MNSIIVYGPPGCGKTLQKNIIANYFNKSYIVDGWAPGDNIPDNALIFTNVSGVKDALIFDDIINDITELSDISHFKDELCRLINTYNIEDLVDMPDYLLAEMLCNVIHAVSNPIKRTLDWHNADSVCHPRQR